MCVNIKHGNPMCVCVDAYACLYCIRLYSEIIVKEINVSAWLLTKMLRGPVENH